MIVKSPPSPVTCDPPPSYCETNSPQPGSSVDSDIQETHTDASPSPPSSVSTSTAQKTGKLKTKSSKWRFPLSRSVSDSKEIKSTISRIVRDTVTQPTTSSAIALLNNCADTCKTQSISFSSLLQEPFIEDHSAIYWAIVTRPSTHEYEFIMALMSNSAPLTEKTVSEIRLACLHTGDSVLFQKLWRTPFFSVVPGSDQMLLGGSAPQDSIDVEELPGNDGSFNARVRIIQFQKRMKVTGQISLEFLARGRIWKMKFHIVSKMGYWAMTLSILEHSPPTWLDSRFVIQEPEHPAAASVSPPPSPGILSTFRGNRAATLVEPPPKPPLSYRLKTNGLQLGPIKKRGFTDSITILFDKEPLGGSLQYLDSPYYGTDGVLNATLRARLIWQSEGTGCIIC